MMNDFNNEKNYIAQGNKPNMRDDKKSIKSKIIGFFFAFSIIFAVLFLANLILKTIKLKEETREKITVLTDALKISAVGYEFDEPFNPNKFEYNLEIDTTKVQIKCTKEQTEGCNEVIDLGDKTNYKHTINYISSNEKSYVYTININKKNTSGEIQINSIELDNTTYTKEGITITVVATSSTKKKLKYSFDAGNTWQDSNKYTVSENTTVLVKVKDSENNNETQVKTIEIDTIDKISPTVDVMIKEKTKDAIILQAKAQDNSSDTLLYSWDNQAYSASTTYKINKAGTYKVKVKDKAGNESIEASITIPKSEFDSSVKPVTQKYTATFDKNGADIIEKTSISCETTGSSCTIKMPTITINDGTVIGWAESKDATVAKYKVSETVILTGNKKLYAITRKALKATFNKNGATQIGTKNETTLEKICYVYNLGTNCQITTPIITRTSGTIVGWSTDSNGKESKYNAGAKMTLTNNINLYAITKKELKATFNKNGATTIDGKTSTSVNRTCYIFNAAASCQITTPAITRTSGTIVGWSTDSNGKESKYNVGTKITLTNNINLYAITKRELKATFNKNGATTIDGKTSASVSRTCFVFNTGTSCQIMTPAITRSSGTIVGWATASSNHTANYGVNLNITLKQNIILYAITLKKITISFDANGGEYLSESSKSCTMYNSATTCSIKIPMVNKKGYASYGFDEKGKITEWSTYHINNSYSFSKSTTLVANYLEKTNHYKKMSVYKSMKLNNMIVEIDDACSNKARFVTDINDAYKNMPHLFKGYGKIMVLSDSLYEKMSTSSDGVTSGFDTYPYVYLKCRTDYTTIIHELTHKIDKEYYIKNGVFMANKDDTVKLYNKYKALFEKNKTPLRQYSYTNHYEFLAEITAYYYAKFIKKDSKFSSYYYPEDIKTFVEKNTLK